MSMMELTDGREVLHIVQQTTRSALGVYHSRTPLARWVTWYVSSPSSSAPMFFLSPGILAHMTMVCLTKCAVGWQGKEECEIMGVRYGWELQQWGDCHSSQGHQIRVRARGGELCPECGILITLPSVPLTQNCWWSWDHRLCRTASWPHTRFFVSAHS